MSHVTGTVQPVSPVINIGPDFGPATNPPNTWTHNFVHVLAPTGTRLVMLHFTGASLPANNRLEVDLGYGGEMDVFTSADGSDFWTRPINISTLPGGLVPIRYITNGAATGGVQLDQYGRGERHTKNPENPSAAFDSFSNCDPFLLFLQNGKYLEPDYPTFWFHDSTSPHWENAACVAPAGDIRNTVAPSVGMIMGVDFQKDLGFHLSTCSVTLVGPDTVITAGHCMQNPVTDAKSSSVIFGYQPNCDGTKPGGYSPRVVKVKEVIRQRFADGTPNDYCLLRLKTPVPGLTPIPMRTDIPAPPEQVFGLHHPNGAVKKLSIPHPGFATIVSSNTNAINLSLDVSGGSSGSGLFDTAGRIVGVLSNGNSSSLTYFPVSSIQKDIASPPAITRDVMIVFDRSGSMSLPGTTGIAKIEEARAAASLFVQLVRAGTGNRVGMVSFSTSASSPIDFPLTAVNKVALIGPAPYTSGLIGGLMPGGSTSLGDGLNKAYSQLTPGANPRNILLLTDGLQNTPPFANAASPAGIVIDVIGYGTPANLDGTFLTALATNHDGTDIQQQGQYVLADTNLKLQKFFALAFGNIFEAGLLMDPEFVLPKDQRIAAPVPFNVCEEEAITIVVGWDNRETQLFVEVTTPLGNTVTSGSPGVEASSSLTWTFLRIPLPQGGERDGTWKATVFRPGGGEFPPPAPEVHYFINVVASGGAMLRRMPDNRRYYTGDVINPLVGLQYLQGGLPPNAKLQVTVSRPDTSVGNLLSQEKLGASKVIDADTIPPRQATLMEIEQRTGKSSVGYTQQTFDLFDDYNSFEAAGLFGNPLKDLLTMEGNYTFHCQATYGDQCTATRELLWTLHVEPGIDASCTTMTATVIGGVGTITIVPRDKYCNNVGPGRGDGLTITGAPGTVVTGPVTDNGDGSYTVPVDVDPSSGNSPGVIVGQPGRPPVVVHEPKPPMQDYCEKWKLLCLGLLILLLFAFLLWLL
jgi:hypothetical protein